MNSPQSNYTLSFRILAAPLRLPEQTMMGGFQEDLPVKTGFHSFSTRPPSLNVLKTGYFGRQTPFLLQISNTGVLTTNNITIRLTSYTLNKSGTISSTPKELILTNIPSLTPSQVKLIPCSIMFNLMQDHKFEINAKCTTATQQVYTFTHIHTIHIKQPILAEELITKSLSPSKSLVHLKLVNAASSSISIRKIVAKSQALDAGLIEIVEAAPKTTINLATNDKFNLFYFLTFISTKIEDFDFRIRFEFEIDDSTARFTIHPPKPLFLKPDQIFAEVTNCDGNDLFLEIFNQTGVDQEIFIRNSSSIGSIILVGSSGVTPILVPRNSRIVTKLPVKITNSGEQTCNLKLKTADKRNVPVFVPNLYL